MWLKVRKYYKIWYKFHYSPQVKQNIVSIKRSIFFTYKPHQHLALNLRLRILENQPKLGKSQKCIGRHLSILYPLKATSPEAFHTGPKTIHKNRYQKFSVLYSFVWVLDFLSKYFAKYCVYTPSISLNILLLEQNTLLVQTSIINFSMAYLCMGVWKTYL